MDQQSFANRWAWANDDYDANSQSWKSSSNDRFTWKASNYIPLGTTTPKPLSAEERSQRRAHLAELNAEKAERKAQKAARKSERKRKKKLQQQQRSLAEG